MIIAAFSRPIIVILILAASITQSFPIAAQKYESGESAYKRGDYKNALKHFEPLAELGNAKAQSNLGFMYGQGIGVPQDFNLSIDWFKKAAAQNNTDAQHNLGIIHGNGLGVPQDHFLAYLWFSLAAANNHASSKDKKEQAAAQLNQYELRNADSIVNKCLKFPNYCIKFAKPGKII